MNKFTCPGLFPASPHVCIPLFISALLLNAHPNNQLQNVPDENGSLSNQKIANCMKRIACHSKLWFFLAFIMYQATAFANHPPLPPAFTVSGKVVDDKGNTLAGASVAQKGNANATTTAGDGSFSLTVQERSAVLVISYVGFQSKEVSVNAGTHPI
jgi:hypothetical protein